MWNCRFSFNVYEKLGIDSRPRVNQHEHRVSLFQLGSENAIRRGDDLLMREGLAQI